MILAKAFRKTKNSVEYRDVDFVTPGFLTGDDLANSNDYDLKVSAVFACVNVLSNSISKLPFFVVDTNTNKHIDNDPLYQLLALSPVQGINPSVFKKLLETWRLLHGNAYAYPVHNMYTGVLEKIIPLSPDKVEIVKDGGQLFYDVTLDSHNKMRLFPEEILHFKGMTFDGIHGVSVLDYARTVIKTGMMQERYQTKFYENSGRPEGTLTTDGDLDKAHKDVMRDEWNKVHQGPDNAFKIAVLSNGVKYTPITQLSPQQAEFVASKAVTVADIARYFGVPLYKINAGKESYSSNEQNAIGYVTDTLAPIVGQYEDEFTLKCISQRDQQRGCRVKANMNVELRGDTTARGNWYKTMREIGVYSVNDVRALEDLEGVDGGDVRNASLNYVPLNLFEQLSISRNQPQNKQEEDEKTK